jgi:Flp pilus assembly protein TadG
MTPRRTKRTDEGTVTMWALAFCIALLMFGGLSIDLWRAITAYQRLASAADAAAATGGSGIDETVLRDSGGRAAQLDPALAEQLAYESLDRQADRLNLDAYDATATTEDITVTVHATVNLTFVDLALDGPLTMSATATADPRLSG